MSDKQIQQIERQIDEQISKINRAHNFTIIFTVVIIIFFVGYMGYLSTLTSQLKSDDLADELAYKIEEELPKIREELSKSLVADADKKINDGIDGLLAEVPKSRIWFEGYAKETIEKQTVVIDQAFGELFKNSIQQGRAEILPILEHVNNTNSQHELEEVVFEILHNQLNQPEVLADVNDYGDVLLNVADKLEHLRKNEGLTKSEERERLLLVALREISIRSDQELEKNPVKLVK
jgi:hypothetical protein